MVKITSFLGTALGACNCLAFRQKKLYQVFMQNLTFTFQVSNWKYVLLRVPVSELNAKIYVFLGINSNFVGRGGEANSKFGAFFWSDLGSNIIFACTKVDLYEIDFKYVLIAVCVFLRRAGTAKDLSSTPPPLHPWEFYHFSSLNFSNVSFLNHTKFHLYIINSPTVAQIYLLPGVTNLLKKTSDTSSPPTPSPGG